MEEHQSCPGDAGLGSAEKQNGKTRKQQWAGEGQRMKKKSNGQFPQGRSVGGDCFQTCGQMTPNSQLEHFLPFLNSIYSNKFCNIYKENTEIHTIRQRKLLLTF